MAEMLKNANRVLPEKVFFFQQSKTQIYSIYFQRGLNKQQIFTFKMLHPAILLAFLQQKKDIDD